MSATELEKQIYEKEEIRIVIRCAADETFDAYPYNRKAASNTSISDWYETRLKPLLDNKSAEIIDGAGTRPHGRTKIEKVRNSYNV